MTTPHSLSKDERVTFGVNAMRAALRVSLLAAVAGASFLASPAQAQQYWGWGWGGSLFYKPPLLDRPPAYIPGDALPPGEINAILRDEGYRPLGRPVLQGDVYIAQVETHGGARYRVVLHAFDGEILERRLVARTSPDRRTGERPSIRRENNTAGLPREPLPQSPPADLSVSPPPPAPVIRPAPREEAAVPPRPVETAPLPAPRTNEAVAPPVAPAPVIRPEPRSGVAATPPSTSRPAPPRSAPTVSPAPVLTPTDRPAASRDPGAAPTLTPTDRPAAAPPAEASPPQQARSAPRVILPNPQSNNSAPAQSLEVEPSRPAPPTPQVPAAPLD
jgi:hypothetical protein